MLISFGSSSQEKVVLVDNEDDENEMLGLNERLAAYHIDSSPEPSAAMEIEETISEETMVEKSDKDTEFVADPKGGKKKGGKKPAATANTVKPAAATRKRGPAAKKPLLSQKLITDVLKPAEVGSPDKKVRKLRPSPFNKKSSSVLGRIGDTEQSGSSSSASGSPVDANEVVAAKPRPQRANRKAAIVLSSSESDDSSDDSEFDA
ncbi:hypothetical protein IFM89_021044 [Coptis chinensis]|uniref:Uncharacterized protein n=1 Tax=Coptis chinensis TaxID=261450 RepID=A0A835LF72_9MAGN|nr:hypothetical protein IFM89_021044 [Coptis chinensis]